MSRRWCLGTRQRKTIPRRHQQRRRRTPKPRPQRLHRRTRPKQRPGRLPLLPRTISFHGAVAIAVETVSFPGSDVVRPEFEFECRRDCDDEYEYDNGATAAEETEPFSRQVQISHPRETRRRRRRRTHVCQTPREQRQRRQRRREAEEDAFQVETRRSVSIAGGVSFPVSGEVQVHRSSERVGSSSSSSAASASSSQFHRRLARQERGVHGEALRRYLQRILQQIVPLVVLFQEQEQGQDPPSQPACSDDADQEGIRILSFYRFVLFRSRKVSLPLSVSIEATAAAASGAIAADDVRATSPSGRRRQRRFRRRIQRRSPGRNPRKEPIERSSLRRGRSFHRVGVDVQGSVRISGAEV
mmetsp:Transcript_2763/g.5895  ORF Transcript_2763/g.5895 Transcript_2763/m.5895 type:complete len:357 (+) Transcript_2763:210-1280(+)